MKKGVLHCLLAILAISVLFVSARSVETISEQKTALEVMYLPSSEFMDIASLRYDNLAADLLWFKAVQYYGGYMMAQNGIRLFTHLADVITDLDPKFKGAYKLSALIISQDLGDFEAGVSLMEKGLRNNPDDFWMAYEMGFMHYIGGRDYEKAEKYFRHAATLPGADGRAARFAADAARKGGNYEAAIALWSEVAENSDNRVMREMAEKYIEKIKKASQGGAEVPQGPAGPPSDEEKRS